MYGLFKLWLAGAAVSTGLTLYERSKGGGGEDVDPYLSMGKERYDVLARFVMRNDRKGFMKKLDEWGLPDMEMRQGIWRFIAAKCG